MENIQKNIGDNLRSIRKNRGYSLDHVAELTGVSKAMLGQIERGDSNPTVSTLWKIARGLQISFSSLIQEESSNIMVVKHGSIIPVTESDGNYRVYSIFPFDPRKKFEIFTVEIEAGCTHVSEKHNEGLEEYITIINGELELSIGEESLHLVRGDSIRFLANKTHTYKNNTNELTTYQLVMHYP
ncbi:helix-turn-helix domain-containing protein [Robertmurraya massiliosenegalensis]|uniref:helix-turn-helix domain-containing protein n=1 Tax=Robertmurraya massiliosenegalensis TaxID=1287657 RepID=UPI0002DDEB12|nr:XRE family transcriptional regulator [Robertmurraya massiliosenegalensis]